MIEKAKPIAAYMLEASEDDLEFAAAASRSRELIRASRWPRLPSRPYRRTTGPKGSSRTWIPTAAFDPVTYSYPHGTHLAAMEVDTETGAVTIRKYVCRR